MSWAEGGFCLLAADEGGWYWGDQKKEGHFAVNIARESSSSVFENSFECGVDCKRCGQVENRFFPLFPFFRNGAMEGFVG